MESTTHRLSAYPYLIPVPAAPETAYQTRSLHRRRPEIRRMSDNDIKLLRRSDSFMDLKYQGNNTYHFESAPAARPRPIISGPSTPASKYGSADRKGELRYDFRFGGDFERSEDASLKQVRGGRDRNSVFTVASARTLCSLSSEPSTPTSPSPPFPGFYSSSAPPSPSPPVVAPKPVYAITSRSTLTPMLHGQPHGMYCRLKTFLLGLLHLHLKSSSSSPTSPTTSTSTICSHKFHHGRCKRCDLPEAILPYLDGGLLRSGFYCRDFGCEACCGNIYRYGEEEEEMVEGLRVATLSTQSTISDEAPQIGPINFIPISTYRPPSIDSDSISTSADSFASRNFSFSSSSLFESTPNPRGTQTEEEPKTSPTTYSFHVPPYPSSYQRGTSAPRRTPTFTTPNKDYIVATDNTHINVSPSPSPQSTSSTSSTSILEVNVPATAVPIIQASPTTIHIRHSRPGTANQPPAPSSPSPTHKSEQNLELIDGGEEGDL